MKITNLKKCSLYLQINDPDHNIDYDIVPTPDSVTTTNNISVLDFIVDINSPTILKIVITRRDGITAHLLVDRIEVAGTRINDLNKISFMKTSQGKIKQTNGYLDDVGIFKINLHTNPISLNSLNYLLSLTKQH